VASEYAKARRNLYVSYAWFLVLSFLPIPLLYLIAESFASSFREQYPETFKFVFIGTFVVFLLFVYKHTVVRAERHLKLVKERNLVAEDD